MCSTVWGSAPSPWHSGSSRTLLRRECIDENDGAHRRRRWTSTRDERQLDQQNVARTGCDMSEREQVALMALVAAFNELWAAT